MNSCNKAIRLSCKLANVCKFKFPFFIFLVFCLTCICIGDGNKDVVPMIYELDCVYAKVASLHGGHAHCARYGVLTCVINLWSQSFKLIEGNFTMFKSEVGVNIVVIGSFTRRNLVLANQENND